MLIKVGNKIKSLRNKNNVTQDRLADYLGVTAQAISRWESEVCYPDIEIFPAIADYFDVSVDELMGVDASKKNEKIQNYINQAWDLQSQGEFDKAVEICRTSLREFPSSELLQVELACAIGCMDNGIVISAELSEEAEALCIRVLDHCVNDQLRYRTLAILCWIYARQMKDAAKAYELAKRFPKLVNSMEFVLAETFKKDLPETKRREFLKEYTGQMLILFTNPFGYSANLNEQIDALIDELRKFKG